MTWLRRALRVAVVGAGPSGVYTVSHLLEQPAGTFVDGQFVRRCHHDVEVDLIDRLPTPWGLVRGGVAPDHPEKKAIAGLFERIVNSERVRFFGGIEVGRDVEVDELRRWYDAVVYAYGTSRGRTLQVPGAELAGVHTAHDVVGWYNGHPDHTGHEIDLDTPRAVVIGNGNVALDVARVLARPPHTLAQTDIAEHALHALHASAIREVIVIGRRGPLEAAFGDAELEEFLHLPDVEMRIRAGGRIRPFALPSRVADGRTNPRRRATLRALAGRPAAARRVTFLFHRAPHRLLGADRVHAVELTASAGPLRGRRTRVGAGLVIAAIGSRSEGLPGLPFDPDRGIISTRDGRVVDGTTPILGTYATGWIKRGPSGVIGTNKACARDTVGALLADVTARALPSTGTLSPDAVRHELSAHQPHMTTWSDWQRIDTHERALGAAAGRPRTKLTSHDALRTAAATVSITT